jgi:nucleotide-binding universal stress UspA family protein
MNGPVVVGIDDFEHSDHLITTAVREAQTRGTALWLAHAYHGYAPVTPGIPPGFASERILHDEAEIQLQQLSAKLEAEYPGLWIRTAAMAGPATAALADLASPASLLVVGGRGAGGFAGQLLGSVSLGVLAHAHCPVLVVRGDRDHATDRVMVGIDATTPVTGAEVVEFAFAEAARRHAAVYAFYAWEDPSLLYAYGGEVFTHDQRAMALKHGREELAAALEPWKQLYPQVTVSSEVIAGLPAKLLVEATRLADLVVIGGKARTHGHEGMRIGSIAHAVLHHADCPVAIVPQH